MAADLVMQSENFQKFANLLLNLYLLFKENKVKQAILDKVWKFPSRQQDVWMKLNVVVKFLFHGCIKNNKNILQTVLQGVRPRKTSEYSEKHLNTQKDPKIAHLGGYRYRITSGYITSNLAVGCCNSRSYDKFKQGLFSSHRFPFFLQELTSKITKFSTLRSNLRYSSQ